MKKISFVLLMLLFLFSFAKAQQAARNNGNLQVHSGGSITSFGTFTNASTASLVNNGSVYIKGNLINDQSSMSAGSGTLYINGTVAQAVNGAAVFRTNHLNTDNSTGITLNNNLSVSGSHTFSNGLITTSATPNYMIYEAGSSYSGSGDTRHINGWVKKIGSTSFTFPVGDATYERPVAISSLSGSSEYNARYYTTTPNTAYSYMQNPLVMVNPNEYWAVNQVSGGTAAVTLNWDYSKVYFPNWIVPDLRVAGFNGSRWVNQGGTASGTTTTTGTITSNSISSFGIFAIGSASWVLPVTLISFDAIRQNGITDIKWVTENEYNTRSFIVERSDNGTNFSPIAQLSGRNRKINEHYTIPDKTPINNIAFYRLRITDENGKEAFSRIVAVSDISKKSLTLFSNPVHSQAVLIAGGQLNGSFDYYISTAAGQSLQQGKLNIQSGGVYHISLSNNINPGTYILRVTNGIENFSYKMIVQ